MTMGGPSNASRFTGAVGETAHSAYFTRQQCAQTYEQLKIALPRVLGFMALKFSAQVWVHKQHSAQDFDRYSKTLN